MADAESISDSFSSYLDSNISGNKEYEEMVGEVLDASGCKWEKVVNSIPACDGMYTIWL